MSLKRPLLAFQFEAILSRVISKVVSVCTLKENIRSRWDKRLKSDSWDPIVDRLGILLENQF